MSTPVKFEDVYYDVKFTYNNPHLFHPYAYQNVKLNRDGLDINIYHKDGHLITKLKFGSWSSFQYRPANANQ